MFVNVAFFSSGHQDMARPKDLGLPSQTLPGGYAPAPMENDTTHSCGLRN